MRNHSTYYNYILHTKQMLDKTASVMVKTGEIKFYFIFNIYYSYAKQIQKNTYSIVHTLIARWQVKLQ